MTVDVDNPANGSKSRPGVDQLLTAHIGRLSLNPCNGGEYAHDHEDRACTVLLVAFSEV